MKLKQFYFALILLNPYTVNGQELDSFPQAAPAHLNYAQQDVMYSKILSENRKINIYLPDNFEKSSEQLTYPVLVLLEDEFFYMVSGVVKHLSSVERMPETIVVSILDMTYIPTVYTNGSTFWPSAQLSDENPDPFTRHLKEELFPYLKTNYRANDFRMIMGLSSTALYAFHTFVKEPELFNAHIAIAAGDILGMGYEEGENFISSILDEVERSRGKIRYLYVTSADSDGHNYPEIEKNLLELERTLRPLHGEEFKFISRIFPNEGHYDVALPAFLEALTLIFPTEDWSPRYRDIVNESGNALKNIDRYYQQLSIKYGFEILPRAERWNSVNRLSWIGPYLIRQGRITEGIEIIERWAEYCPKSTLALSELAKAYEANGELRKALAAMTRAYNLAKELNQDMKPYGDQLEKLNSQINDK